MGVVVADMLAAAAVDHSRRNDPTALFETRKRIWLVDSKARGAHNNCHVALRVSQWGYFRFSPGASWRCSSPA